MRGKPRPGVLCLGRDSGEAAAGRAGVGLPLHRDGHGDGVEQPRVEAETGPHRLCPWEQAHSAPRHVRALRGQRLGAVHRPTGTRALCWPHASLLVRQHGHRGDFVRGRLHLRAHGDFASRGASSKQQDVSLWDEAGVGSVAMRASERSCDLAVTVLNRTTSGGHKFKLRGVTLYALPRGARRRFLLVS